MRSAASSGLFGFHLVGMLMATVLYVMSTTNAAAVSRAQQRIDFQAATTAIAAGDRATFFALEAKLRSYVLHSHLRYLLAMDRVEHAPWPEARAAALAFARSNPDSELSRSLMRATRRRLRDEKNWAGVIESRDWPGAGPMPCLELRARVALGQQRSLREADLTRWERLSWPADCQVAFDALIDQNRISGAALWRRIAALMDRGRVESARDFLPLLSDADDALLMLWIAGHSAPQDHVEDPLIRGNTAFNRNMAHHFVSRWARQDPVSAAGQIAKFLKSGRYDRDTYGQMLRTVGIRAAVDYHPEALKLLDAIPENQHSERTRAWQVRSALRSADWQAVADAISRMPTAQRDKATWRYWSGVAAWQLGDTEAGRDVLTALSVRRSYYGFLAADRVGADYNLTEEITPRDSAVRASLQSRLDVQRAREYWAVGLEDWAQRSWGLLSRSLTKPEFTELVTMARDWGWHNRAIAGNASTPYDADLTLRFPFAFREAVSRHARAQSLDPSWVYATARRESGFRPDVQSAAGAVGLMQLMPATAREVAKARGESRAGDLTDPSRNIQLGTHYLAQLRERFKGSTALVSAGYNAGPSRIRRWTTDNWTATDEADAARWVETLPIDETRNYVQAVMAYATVYDVLANGHLDVRLTDRLGEVPAPG